MAKNVEIMDTALRRIFAAAQGILSGEENPTEVAQDIQWMALRALKGEEPKQWPFREKGGLPRNE